MSSTHLNIFTNFIGLSAIPFLFFACYLINMSRGVCKKVGTMVTWDNTFVWSTTKTTHQWLSTFNPPGPTKQVTWIPDLAIAFTTFKILTVIFIVVFVVFPLIFRYSYGLQCKAVFLNFIHVPYISDYSQPQKYGLDGTRNFYLTTEDGITLGVWQILPENLVNSFNETDDQFYENILGNGQDVVIYHHGNAGTRLTGHRVELYKILRKHFHVVTFDYRSYGDSTNVRPSEKDVVKDCLHIYNWVSNRTSGNLFIWAHSLGTSLAMHSLALLQSEGIRPMGVILEAPFNNMREEISEFPLAKIFKGLPWFSYTVIEPLQSNGFTFKTDKFICAVNAPILILHAEDDHVVPFRLGYKLYEDGLRCRKASQGKLSFHGFNGKYGYDHKYICRDPGIHDIIRNFVELAVKESEQMKRS